MVNILRGACRIAVLAIFAGQYSCIDKQYDLSDLDTDDITIGQIVLLVDTRILPRENCKNSNSAGSS